MTPSSTRRTAAPPFLAFLAGTGVAAVLILIAAGGNVDRMTSGDGEIHRYVAQHLTIAPDDVHPSLAESGPSLRYGRIGLPAALWLTSGGSHHIMRYVQPILMALSAGAASAAMVRLLPRAPRAILLVPFLVPGFGVAITGGFAEAPLLALMLWAITLALDDRWGWAAVLLGVGLVTKENAIVVVFGLGIWALLRKRPQALVGLVAGLIPVGGWYLFVRQRFGYLPPLDPFLRDTADTVGAPVLALGRSLVDPLSPGALAIALLHVTAWAVCIVLVRRSLFGLLGTVAGIQLLGAAPGAWVFLGDAVRISLFIQTFLFLTVIAWKEPAWTHPRALPAWVPSHADSPNLEHA